MYVQPDWYRFYFPPQRNEGSDKPSELLWSRLGLNPAVQIEIWKYDVVAITPPRHRFPTDIFDGNFRRRHLFDGGIRRNFRRKFLMEISDRNNQRMFRWRLLTEFLADILTFDGISDRDIWRNFWQRHLTEFPTGTSDGISDGYIQLTSLLCLPHLLIIHEWYRLYWHTHNYFQVFATSGNQARKYDEQLHCIWTACMEDRHELRWFISCSR